MKLRTSIVTALTLISLTLVSVFLFPTSEAQQKQPFERKEIPVSINRMNLRDGIVPVEIQCEPVFITQADTLEQFSCVLINVSHKTIRASSVQYSLIFERNGKEERTNRIDVADTYIHPDLFEERKAIAPGGKIYILAPGPLVQRNSLIKALELEPLYLEFIDGSTLGADQQSAAMIARVREGALQYKNAIRQEYRAKGRSVKAVIDLLENGADQEAATFDQKAGANAYRKFLRRKYDSEGPTALSQILDN